MFSQTAEYALRATVCMAQHPDRLLTNTQIAKMTHVPPGYLSKILQNLARAEVIHATRGLGGGYRLELSAEAITILEVINAVDPIKRSTRCPLNLPSHGGTLCSLHRRLDDAIAEVERVMGMTTLAEIINEPSPSVPLYETSATVQ